MCDEMDAMQISGLPSGRQYVVRRGGGDCGWLVGARSHDGVWAVIRAGREFASQQEALGAILAMEAGQIGGHDGFHWQHIGSPRYAADEMARATAWVAGLGFSPVLAEEIALRLWQRRVNPSRPADAIQMAIAICMDQAQAGRGGSIGIFSPSEEGEWL